MNRSTQFDVSSYAENASGTPDHPGTYSTHTHVHHNMALSHPTEHKSGEHPHLSPHTVHYFAQHTKSTIERT